MIYNFGPKIMIPVNIIMVLILLFLRFKKRKSYIYLSVLFLFLIYLQQAIRITLFPIHIGVFNNIDASIIDCMNFKPFGFSLHYIKNVQIWGNILLTIPLGFTLPLIFNIKNKISILISILTSSLFELTQLLFIIFLKELTFVFDINDILLNAFGSVLGFLVLYLFAKVFTKIKKDNKQLSAFQEYINKLCFNIVHDNSSLKDL